jgi:hypothetical protein
MSTPRPSESGLKPTALNSTPVGVSRLTSWTAIGQPATEPLRRAGRRLGEGTRDPTPGHRKGSADVTAASDTQEGHTREARGSCASGPCPTDGVRAGIPPLRTQPRWLATAHSLVPRAMAPAHFRGRAEPGDHGGDNTSTLFGQAWLILNPLLLVRRVLHPGGDHSPPERSGLLRPSHQWVVRIPAGEHFH